MPAPATLELGVGDERADHELEQGAEEGEGQSGAGLTVGRLGEDAAGLERDVCQGRVAMENLDDEPEDGGEGGQEGITAPAVVKFLAEAVDGGLVEVGIEVLLEPAQGGINPLTHGVASLLMDPLGSTMMPGGPPRLKSLHYCALRPEP